MLFRFYQENYAEFYSCTVFFAIQSLVAPFDEHLNRSKLMKFKIILIVLVNGYNDKNIIAYPKMRKENHNTVYLKQIKI